MLKKIKWLFLLILLFSCENGKERSKNTNRKSNSRVDFLKAIADSLYHGNVYISAIRYFDTLIRLDSGKGEYYYKQGFSYDMVYKQPKLQPAIKDYFKAIELGYNIEKSYYNLGLSYMFVEDSTAIVYFQNCLKANPNNADAIYLIQQCNERLRKKGTNN